MATIGQYGHILNELTKQQVMDHATKHLLTQNQKSSVDPFVGSGSTCRYSGPDGLCCAAAPFLLKDKLDSDFYENDMDGLGWLDAIGLGYAYSNHSNIICNLQCIHDTHTPDEWAYYLGELYGEYGLDPKILESFKKG